MLRSLSDAVETTCPCADVRGINSPGQKRGELCWVDWPKLCSENESREAGGMLLNFALRNWCRTSFYLSRSINKSKITGAWPGIWIFLGQGRRYIKDNFLLSAACQCPDKRCQVSTGMAWSDTHLREPLEGISSGFASFLCHSRQRHNVGSTSPSQS